MKKLIEFFTEQTLFGILLALFAIIIGIASVFLIRREVFPNVAYDIITVTTVFPGASAQESEQLVTNPLERELKELDGIKRIESHSIDGISTIVVHLDPDQTSEEDAKSDIRDLVDRVKPKLPDDSEEPVISSLESKQQPIIEVCLSGTDMSELELREYAKRLEDEIESIKGVARIKAFGLRDLEILVETNQKKLARYQLSLNEVIQALNRQNLSIPGGVIEVDPKDPNSLERSIRTYGQFDDLDGVGNTVIRGNALGQSIRVRDIATVKYGLEKPTLIDHTNGKRSIRLTVLKKEKSDAIVVVDKVIDHVNKTVPKLSEKLQVEYVNDLSYLIRRRLKILTTNLSVGLVLVAILLSLLLPMRVALIVSVGIPFSFFGTMILFNAWGNSINLISMIGLIIVSGMLVDDAIVVTDHCISKMESGLPPRKAAMEGAYQIWIPVTASVMTTIVVFVPMLYMSGIFGKFVREIPMAVIVALLISLIEAFFILPGHIAEWVRLPKNGVKKGEGKLKKLFRKKSPPPQDQVAPVAATHEAPAKPVGKFAAFWESTIVPSYLSVVRFNLKHRWSVGFAATAFVIGSFVIAGTAMRLILFPADDVEIFMVRTAAPTGTSLQQTERLVKPLEDAVATLPSGELKNYTTNVGLHVDGDQTKRRGSQYAQVTVFLTPPNTRERGDAEIIKEVRDKIGTPPGLEYISVERVNPGPPVGKPVDLGLQSKNYEDILPAVKAMKEFLGEIEGVTDIEDSYLMGKEEIRLEVIPDEAAAANISVADIGTAVRASYEGIVATTVRRLDEEIDVRVSLTREEREQGETLRKLKVPNPLNNLVPISRVAKMRTTQGLAEYEHEGFERQIGVTAEIDTNISTASIVNAQVRKALPDFKEKFPKVTITFGGEDQDTQESMASLGRAFIVALMGVFLLLVLTFRNLLHPLLVFSTIPLGLTAVIWAFLIHGKPLTFMGMLGAIALAGVIVNNSIVFIDFVNRKRQEGMNKDESILEAARHRLRPIFLTTLTTTVGLLPTTYGIGGLDKFVVYITMALSWGLLLGSFLTSMLLPTAIGISDRINETFRRFFPASNEAY